MDKENKLNIDYNDLIVRFFNGEISDSEIALLKQWVHQSENNKQEFIGKKITWMASSQLKSGMHYLGWTKKSN
jgi:hypothetical protein